MTHSSLRGLKTIHSDKNTNITVCKTLVIGMQRWTAYYSSKQHTAGGEMLAYLCRKVFAYTCGEQPSTNSNDEYLRFLLTCCGHGDPVGPLVFLIVAKEYERECMDNGDARYTYSTLN